MQLYKKCSTIKVHFLHHSSGRVTEDSRQDAARQENETATRRCQAATLHSWHLSSMNTLVKLSVVKATIFQLSSLNPV